MRHGIDLKPIHNVKDGGQSAYPPKRDLVSVTGDNLVTAPPNMASGGGAYRDRTDDLKLAKLALSQLS